MALQLHLSQPSVLRDVGCVLCDAISQFFRYIKFAVKAIGKQGIGDQSEDSSDKDSVKTFVQKKPCNFS